MNTEASSAPRVDEEAGLALRQLSTSAVDTGTQLILRMMYREAAARGDIPTFADVGFSNFSQTDEDGILWFLLSVTRPGTRRMIELGAGDGTECNAANLVLNHQYQALLVEANADYVTRGREFLSRRSLSVLLPPAFVHSWITRENVDNLIRDNGFEGPVDVLCIDLDGIDYWVWEALTAAHPAIVVIEFNPALSDGPAVTIPYAPDFMAKWVELDVPPLAGSNTVGTSYHGASLRAMAKLGRRKGYRLVGTNHLRFNAFFVRDDLARDVLPEVEVSDCFKDVAHIYATRGEALLKQPWVEV